MKILIVGQYFWPENFRINDLALGLQERGHEVTVFTGKPNFHTGHFYKGYSFFGKAKENWQGIPIYRAPLITRGSGKGIRLILNYLSFAIFGSIKALFVKIPAETILVYQQSPVILALPGIVYKWKNRAKLVLYVQDLWPESVTATTNIKGGFVIKVLNSITNWIYRRSDTILIQSNAFRHFLESRNVPPAKIVYLPNTAESLYQKREKLPELAKYFPGEMNIVFAGTIGAAQSFETLVAAAKLVKEKDPGICWVIIGDGRMREDLIGLVKKEQLEDVFRFIGFFELEKMPLFFAYADALLISLKKDLIFSLTVPAKLQSYMACGKPVIGSLDGEGSRIIRDADCGLCSGAEDVDGLARNVLEFRRISVLDRERLGGNALAYYRKEFERNKLLVRLEEVLKK